MLQIEALVQTCALALFTLPGNSGKVAYLISANNIKLMKKLLQIQDLLLKLRF